MIVKFVKGFAVVWVFLILITIILSIVGAYLSTRSIYETWVWFTDTFSPFNLWNTFLLLIIASPAFIAYLIAEKIEKRNTG
jgi:hypothetical protein